MPHILLIEDEAAIADTIVYALQREGFSVDWHTLGAAGQAALAAHGADLLILDVGLPDGSGFERCKQIRSTSDIPIIFLTARSDEIDRIVGLEIGADDYVTKPFSPRELVARVKVILKRRQPATNNGVANGFSHEPDKAQIRYHGKLLELTRYEYLLLATLLTHPERVYSRAQLMQLIWADSLDSLERTVDAHIKTLRGKIRQLDPDCDPIETHRGLGYSFRWPRR